RPAGEGAPRCMLPNEFSCENYTEIILTEACWSCYHVAVGSLDPESMVSVKPASMEKTLTPGRVMFLDGQGELPMIGISTMWSSAEVYLQGAHLTTFRKHGQPPLTFMSQCSRFSEGQPIRGGIPVVFPWFGMREGMGNHGFA